jgi:hypothetical protein
MKGESLSLYNRHNVENTPENNPPPQKIKPQVYLKHHIGFIKKIILFTIKLSQLSCHPIVIVPLQGLDTSRALMDGGRCTM